MKVCVKGPGPDGNTGCDNNTGHMVNEWVNQSKTEQDPVTKAQIPAVYEGGYEWRWYSDDLGIPVL